jgi:hypothetical protein
MARNKFGEYASIRVKNEIYKQFKAYVILNEATITDTVTALMEKWLKEQRKKKDKLLGVEN